MTMRYCSNDEILLAEVLKKPKEYLIAHPDINLNPSQLKKFRNMRKRLNGGQPLAYILGYKWFFGNKFTVNKNVLIPRPETERLVEMALEYSRQKTPTTIIDIGSGSGVIIISLKKALPKTETRFLAVDLSQKAVACAQKNADLILGKKSAEKIRFIKGSLLKPRALLLPRENLLIIANLPYLSQKEINRSIRKINESSIKYEPKRALYGGPKPYQKIQQLIIQTAALKLKKSCLLLEIGYNQGNAIKKLAKKYLPDWQIKIYKDLRGFERIVQLSTL